MYSVQGPKSRDVLNAIANKRVDDLKFFAMMDADIDGIPVMINRGGFTGEKLGYEIYVAPAQKGTVEKMLAEAVAAVGGKKVTEFQVMVLTLPGEKGFYLMRDLLDSNPLEVGLDKRLYG